MEFDEALSIADVEVFADRVRLVQIFRNLFENSLDATQDPLRIEVDAELLTEPRETVQIRVRDNGPGIGPDKRHRLFEPFFTTTSKGTGLGMAIVRRIVEAHGGSIDVGDGQPGAEIVFTLPAASVSSIES